MKKLSLLLIAIAISFTACKKEKKDTKTIETETTETAVVAPKKVKITLSAKSDSNVSGNVVFKEVNGEVSMTAIISELTPGEHAIHITILLIVLLLMENLQVAIGIQRQNHMVNGVQKQVIIKVI